VAGVPLSFWFPAAQNFALNRADAKFKKKTIPSYSL